MDSQRHTDDITLPKSFLVCLANECRWRQTRKKPGNFPPKIPISCEGGVGIERREIFLYFVFSLNEENCKSTESVAALSSPPVYYFWMILGKTSIAGRTAFLLCNDVRARREPIETRAAISV